MSSKKLDTVEEIANSADVIQLQIHLLSALTEKALPKRAKSSEKGLYPVTEGHCFRRIAYDAACEGYWQDKVEPSFIHHADITTLSRAILAATEMLEDPDTAWTLQYKSLGYRR